VAYGTRDHGNQPQLIGFVNDGKTLDPAWIQHVAFRPLDDGLTVKVTADFVATPTPNFVKAGFPAKLGHAGGPIKFQLFGGWSGGGEQVGPDTFRIAFDRFMLARRRGGTLMVMGSHPGDDTYAYTEQACSIAFPWRNEQGKPQTITFADIPDQQLGVMSIELEATSDADLPVRFCVIAGPARIAGSTLTFNRIPPRTKLPVKVTIAAYQWGRSIEPLVQSAEPVERSFLIVGSERVVKE
jgi:hypothetical protein